MNETLLTWVVFILAFGGMVLIHEFGHFIAARMSGIEVDEFGVGLPTPGALTLWVNKGYLILKNGQRVEIPFNFRFPIDPHDLNGRQVRLTVDQVNERLVLRSLEVMNSQGGERRLHCEDVYLMIVDALLAAFHCVEGQTLQRIDQQILERRYLRLFPANTDLGATFAFCRLFTLITKHDFLLFSEMFGLK